MAQKRMARKGILQSLAQVLGLAAEPAADQAPPPNPQVALGRVVPDASRCVQCGVCGYNCPVGIPVRDYAHRGLPVTDPRCITCGQCINVCPRGTLRWETEMHTLVAAQFKLAAESDPALT